MYRPVVFLLFTIRQSVLQGNCASSHFPTFHRRSPRSAIPPSHTSPPRHWVSIEFAEIPRVPRLVPDLATRRVGTVQEGTRGELAREEDRRSRRVVRRG